MGRNAHRVPGAVIKAIDVAPTPPREVAVPARPTGHMAISAAWNMQTSEPPMTNLRAPEAPREARRLWHPPLESGAPMLCRFRAADKAARLVRRAGTTTSQGGMAVAK
eukprot:11718695-Alexandrium_andersonii.AAC.1